MSMYFYWREGQELSFTQQELQMKKYLILLWIIFCMLTA